MKRWLSYVKPYKLYFILGPLCMIIEVAGEVLMPMFLGMIIDGANTGTLTPAKSLGIAGLMILSAVLMMAGGVGAHNKNLLLGEGVARQRDGCGFLCNFLQYDPHPSFRNSRGGGNYENPPSPGRRF